MKRRKHGPRANPTWEGKTAFPPGMPVDLSQLPTLLYQAIEGRVFTLMRWPNESTARGEVPLNQLQDLIAGPVEEGWYDSAGNHLGEAPPGSF